MIFKASLPCFERVRASHVCGSAAQRIVKGRTEDGSWVEIHSHLKFQLSSIISVRRVHAGPGAEPQPYPCCSPSVTRNDPSYPSLRDRAWWMLQVARRASSPLQPSPLTWCGPPSWQGSTTGLQWALVHVHRMLAAHCCSQKRPPSRRLRRDQSQRPSTR